MFISIILDLYLSILVVSYFLFSIDATLSTINKICTTGDSTCGVNQLCVNGRCQCDPTQNRFWTGEELGCRVCPNEYVRRPTRCYKYYPASANHSEARTACRREQADLFSWRDNDDEEELITASITKWGFIYGKVTHQFYTWSGGIVNHHRGTNVDYKISWVDPKGPIINHPAYPNGYTERYCNQMTTADYTGDPEPTRSVKNGETENCVTIVFLPHPNGRGKICMADDFCSQRMGYVCELTEATMLGISGQSTVTKSPSTVGSSAPEPEDESGVYHANDDLPLEAQAQTEGGFFKSKTLFLIGGLVAVGAIGAAAFVMMRKRNDPQTKDLSPAVSVASSMYSSGSGQIDHP